MQICIRRSQVWKLSVVVCAAMTEKIAFMETTDMAVIVSQAQNEIADLRAKGLEIAPHRQRMLKEDLEEAFKDEKNPLRIAFVCAMWITGFDADGSDPVAGLIADERSVALYGTTHVGGIGNGGTVFKLNLRSKFEK
jgi:uncharacterized repeat protein (TIGR03803 family)